MLIRVLISVTSIALIAGGVLALAGHDEATPESRETVVLVHGLARSDASMSSLADRLEDAGFRAVNLDYDSTQHPPGALVRFLASEVEKCCSDADRLHFVTHSLGGILTRAVLAERRPSNLGRVVMLAPPNRGSEIVDEIGGNAFFRYIFGPTGADLGTAPESFPNRLPEPDYEVGVIAGNVSVNPIASAMLPHEGDGAVTVERTKLANMTDHIVVERSHTFIMNAPEVAEQVVFFLVNGHFFRSEEGPTPAASVTGGGGGDDGSS